MAKHQFSWNERFVVYLADGGKCFWCGIPVFYRDVQIDHVFPEDLLDDNSELARIKVEYGLGAQYDINGFENWVTCHQGCNLRKRNTVLPNAPRTLLTVAELKQRAPKLASESKKYASRKRAEEILGMLASALTAGSLTKEDVLDLITDPPQVPIVSAVSAVTIRLSENIELIVPHSPAASIESQGWKIHSVHGNIAYVHDGLVGGVVPNVARPDPSWQCSQCGFYGPWDGIICRTCGNREAPD
jgi:5-methylcytosine-specific restriction endonuclease McrA